MNMFICVLDVQKILHGLLVTQDTYLRLLIPDPTSCITYHYHISGFFVFCFFFSICISFFLPYFCFVFVFRFVLCWSKITLHYLRVECYSLMEMHVILVGYKWGATLFVWPPKCYIWCLHESIHTEPTDPFGLLSQVVGRTPIFIRAYLT